MSFLFRQGALRRVVLLGVHELRYVAALALTIFQCITMEGWSEIMYTAMDAKGYVVSYIYFFAVMLLGSFFALNLLLAVLEEAFDTGSGSFSYHTAEP